LYNKFNSGDENDLLNLFETEKFKKNLLKKYSINSKKYKDELKNFMKINSNTSLDSIDLLSSRNSLNSNRSSNIKLIKKEKVLGGSNQLSLSDLFGHNLSNINEQFN